MTHTTTEPVFSREVGARLRQVRKAKGLSLNSMGDISPWSAASVGSWERAERALTVATLHEVARFYDVPLRVLLVGTNHDQPVAGERRLVFDLGALTWAPADADKLRHFLRSIVIQRGDFNGQILTLRQNDLTAITALVDAETGADAIRQLDAWHILG